MPFGDSITWGVGDEGNAGYRGPLFALAVAAQQKLTFTGSGSNGPDNVSGQPFPKKNEGHNGWTIAQDADRIPPIPGSDAMGAFDNASGGIPNIVLLMIGTNDVYAASGGQSEMANRLGSLLDKIISAAPNALVVVAKITPMTIGGGYLSVVKPYNDAIPGLVQTRAASGKHIVMVDLNTNFNTSTMLGSDGLHPNATGYKFMADRWYSVIGNLLPK
jgi:lysophospholipase L1-like esterase